MKQLSKLLTLAFAVMAMMASAQVPVTSGLLLDLNADSLNLTNGATVSTWADTSGNGNVATNSSGTPTFVANGPGGHAYVGIKGSLSADGYSYTGNNSDYFNLQNTISGVQTIAMVVRRTSNNYYGTSGGQGICMFGGTSAGSWVSAPWAGDNQYGTAFCGNNADPAVLYGNVYINGGSGNQADYTAVSDQFQVLYFTIQQGWGVNLTMDQIATDSQWNSYVFGMDVAELLVYNRALSSGEQASVTSYLTAKYFDGLPVASGLLLDLNADSLNLTNGATVSTWTDISGNGNVATNSSGTPTYVANGINGHAYVGIKGSLSADGYSYTGNNSDYFNLQNTISGVQTIAMVVRRTSNNYYGNQGTNGDQGICMFGGTNTGSYVSAPWAGDHDYGTALCGFNADPAVKYGKVYINGGSGNDAPYTGVLDQFQVLYFTIQQGWGVTLTMDQIATDSQWNTNVFGMDIAKMLVYNRALTSGEQASVTSYLTAKYFPVTLSIAKVGNNVTLTWPVGTLQSSTNVTALYEDLSGATSPYTIPATNAQLFFRVKVQ
jgi:hypothetical protein